MGGQGGSAVGAVVVCNAGFLSPYASARIRVGPNTCFSTAAAAAASATALRTAGWSC